MKAARLASFAHKHAFVLEELKVCGYPHPANLSWCELQVPTYFTGAVTLVVEAGLKGDF